MTSSKAFLSSFLLIIPSFFHLCLCDGGGGGLDQLLPGLGQVAVLKDAQCMQKLLPCQPFLKAPNNPPQTCCGPLSDMANNATDCLCSFLNNPKLFLPFDVSKDEILKLPNACGINVDVSKCNTEGTSSSSGGAEMVDEDLTTEDSTSSTKMNTPYGITYFGVPGFFALLTVLVFSAYQA